MNELSLYTFPMNFDFRPDIDQISIPLSAYKEIKRCPYCKSVFLSDTSCEACGRSLLYHPIGEPFGAKSFYGIKERYIEKQNVWVRFYPQFEDFNSKAAQSFVRQISKRFTDLVSAFNTEDLIEKEQRKLFYVECVDIIDELIRYRISPDAISMLLDENDASLVGKELLFYLEIARTKTSAEISWYHRFLDYRLFGVVRTEFVLKMLMITTTVVTMAVMYKDIISSQFGK